MIAPELFSTTDTIPGKSVLRNYGVVTSTCVLGINMFKDIAGNFRDLVGGRSKTHQNKIREAQRICFDEMGEQASRAGANAIVGVRMDCEELSGGGKSGMMVVVAVGTAVAVG